ncbi:MAG TPA: hypothetical protein VI758_05155, partial [Bacteroidota bacterium]
MKRINILLSRSTRVCLAVALSATITVAGQLPPKSAADVEKKIDTLLKKMTLEEKVGQMTQVTIDVVS